MSFLFVNWLLAFKLLPFTWIFWYILFFCPSQTWCYTLTINVPLEVIIDHYVGELWFTMLALTEWHLRLDRPFVWHLRLYRSFAFRNWTCDYFGNLLNYCALQGHISLFFSHAHGLHLLFSNDFAWKVNLILTSIWHNFTAFKYLLEDVQGWTDSERLPLLVDVIIIFLLCDNL